MQTETSETEPFLLNRLAEGESAVISAILPGEDGLETALRECGFCEGDEVELVTRGVLFGEPLAIRLNRRLIAVRGNEAAHVVVSLRK